MVSISFFLKFHDIRQVFKPAVLNKSFNLIIITKIAARLQLSNDKGLGASDSGLVVKALIYSVLRMKDESRSLICVSTVSTHSVVVGSRVVVVLSSKLLMARRF